MLKSCSYCGGIHDKKHQCTKKPVRKKNTTEVDRFRKLSAWRHKKQPYIMERDKRLCVVCMREGRYTFRDIQVHHIVPLVEDMSLGLDNYNLISLCREHHEEAECGRISREKLQELAKEQEDKYSTM
ncbi:HNH endonuclease [Bacillus sp. OTU530]|uniref:HNH endonuclease n=1 Tax=Bacillus sp. OTU530 TaxID=3043862 RepID=UPI00313B00BC